MAAEYRTVGGFIQFDPNHREYNGKQIQDVLIQNLSGNLDIRVSIWPEANVSVKKGDLIFANGKYTENTSKGKLYRNLDARNIVVFPGNLPEFKVVNGLGESQAPATTEDEAVPF